MKKVKYINSRFTSKEVQQIIKESEDAYRQNYKNPQYIFLQMTYISLTCLLEFIKIGLVTICSTRIAEVGNIRGILSATIRENDWLVLLLSMLWLLMWVMICYRVCSKFINRCCYVPLKKWHTDIYNRAGFVKNKYRKSWYEITQVYDNIESFIKYYDNLEDDRECVYGINSTRLRVIEPKPLGTIQKEFFFGPHLKEIVKDNSVLDFSELDIYYGLIDDFRKDGAKSVQVNTLNN